MAAATAMPSAKVGETTESSNVEYSGLSLTPSSLIGWGIQLVGNPV